MVGVNFTPENKKGTKKRSTETRKTDFEEERPSSKQKEMHEEVIEIIDDKFQDQMSNSNPKPKQNLYSEEKKISKTSAGFSADFEAEYNKYADNVTVSDTFLKPKENISKEKIENDGKIKEITMSNNQRILARVIELNK